MSTCSRSFLRIVLAGALAAGALLKLGRTPRDIRRGRRTAPTSRSSGKRTTARGSSSTRGTLAPRQGSPQARATTSTPPGPLTEHSSPSWGPETVGPASGASTLPAVRRKLSVVPRGSKMHRPGAHRVGPGDRASTLARMPDLPLTGGCLCGGVRFEVNEPLVFVRLLPLHSLPAAHRGAASASGADCTGLAGDRLRGGAHPVLGIHPTTASREVFCSQCGSAPVESGSQDDPEIKSVRLGAFDASSGDSPLPPASSSPMPRRGSRSQTTGCPVPRAPPVATARRRPARCRRGGSPRGRDRSGRRGPA